MYFYGGLYDIQNKKFFGSRDVVFYERQFPFVTNNLSGIGIVLSLNIEALKCDTGNKLIGSGSHLEKRGATMLGPNFVAHELTSSPHTSQPSPCLHQPPTSGLETIEHGKPTCEAQGENSSAQINEHVSSSSNASSLPVDQTIEIDNLGDNLDANGKQTWRKI